jgi:flagellar biosynthesis regulator FlbT
MALAWTLHDGDYLIVNGTTIQATRKVELLLSGDDVGKVEFSNSRRQKRRLEAADATTKTER